MLLRPRSVVQGVRWCEMRERLMMLDVGDVRCEVESLVQGVCASVRARQMDDGESMRSLHARWSCVERERGRCDVVGSGNFLIVPCWSCAERLPRSAMSLDVGS